MATSNIRILYFDESGRAEVSRLILTAAGKKFEDIRFDREKWVTIKHSMPFEQVPCMELDGKKYVQSWAIATFLAKEFGFHGKTNLEGLKIDQVCNLVEDFIQCYIFLEYYEHHETEKAEIKKKVKEEAAPRFLGFCEKLLKESGTGFFVGNSMTLADMAVFDVATEFLREYVEPLLNKFPAVNALVGKVGSNEKIKAYIAGREL